MRFNGFYDGGWQLEVRGCRGGGRGNHQGWPEKWSEITPNGCRATAVWEERERERERERKGALDRVVF